MSSDAINARAMFPGMPGDVAAPPPTAPKSPAKPPPAQAPSEAKPSERRRSDVELGETLYGKPPPPPPPRRVVARSSSSKSEAEKLYPEMDAEPLTSASENAQAKPAQDDPEGGDDPANSAQSEVQEAQEVIQLGPGFDVVAPAGFEEYSAEALDAFAPIVNRTNMSREDAQVLVDTHARALLETVENVHEHNLEQFDAIRREWRDTARRDPELLRGGFQQNLGAAKTVLRQFAPEGLKPLLTEFGITDNPDFIKFLVRTHNAMHNLRRSRWGG